MRTDAEWNAQIYLKFGRVSLKLPSLKFLFMAQPLWPRAADSCPYVRINVCQERLSITWIEADNEQ